MFERKLDALTPPAGAPLTLDGIDFRGRDWARRLYEPNRYAMLHGGRAGGKTTAMAELVVWTAAQERCRIVCARQFATNIDLSVKPAIEDVARRLEPGRWRFDRYLLTHKRTGARVDFQGLDRNPEAMRSWHDVKLVWVEEAQFLTATVWEVLRNSVRADGSRLALTYQPIVRAGPAWDMRSDPPPDAYVRQVLWSDNPHLPATMEAERQLCLEREPDRYAHVWQGEPDDGDEASIVLSWPKLIDAVGDHGANAGGDGSAVVGFDVSGEGSNYHAAVVRRGDVVVRWDRWQSTLVDAVKRVSVLADEHEAGEVRYDAGGVGGGVAGLWPDEAMRVWRTEGENFGGAVKSPGTLYTESVTNGERFRRRNAQMAWGVRDLLADGRLRIDRGGGEDAQELVRQLAQPRRRPTLDGRIDIEKGEPSPDLYDATVLAFSPLSDAGLVAPGRAAGRAFYTLPTRR